MQGCCFFSDALWDMTIPAAGEALKRLVGRQEASTSALHLVYLHKLHKNTHLIEWMLRDPIKEIEWWNNGKWCHLAVKRTPAKAPLCSAAADRYESLTPYFVCEPISSSCRSNGSLQQFFKTHFTDCTGKMKDPWRNICMEECLYFSLIVHLLRKTSKRRVSALLNIIYAGTPRLMKQTERGSLLMALLVLWRSHRIDLSCITV